MKLNTYNTLNEDIQKLQNAQSSLYKKQLILLQNAVEEQRNYFLYTDFDEYDQVIDDTVWDDFVENPDNYIRMPILFDDRSEAWGDVMVIGIAKTTARYMGGIEVIYVTDDDPELRYKSIYEVAERDYDSLLTIVQNGRFTENW